MVLFLLLLLCWVACGFYASAIARDKGHSSTDWFWGGFLIGPVAVIAAAGLADRKHRRILRLIAEGQGVSSEVIDTDPDSWEERCKRAETDVELN